MQGLAPPLLDDPQLDTLQVDDPRVDNSQVYALKAFTRVSFIPFWSVLV